MEKKRRVFYVFDKKLLEASKNLRNIRNKACVVHSLIASYDLPSKCEIIQGEKATDEDLLSFHSAEYLRYLESAQSSSNLELLTDTKDAEKYNLGYDCPLFENIYDFVKIIAGGSLTAAKKLISSVKASDRMPNECLTKANEFRPKSYLKYKYKRPQRNNGEVSTDVFDLPANLSMDENLISHVEINDGEKINAKMKMDVPEGRKESSESSTSDDVIQPVAINWFGGWHHAQRDAAEGFCYVNDIVVALQFLLERFKRILYVDLDIHHGNGVENAFSFSPRVFFLSLHKYEIGFYPASGSLDDVGHGNGKYYTANVPLKGGITDDVYVKIFSTVAKKVFARYKPECVVVQCGADTISEDPLGGFNLTPIGIGRCLKLVLDEKLPTLILGGGGYNVPNVARCWAYLTSVVLNCKLSSDIPDNPYFHLYGPGFELEVTPTLRWNENNEEYVKKVVETVIKNLDYLPNIT